MAIFEDVFKEGLKGGNLTSSGLIAYDGGRAAFSAVSHGAQDVVSEARSEMESESGPGEAGTKKSGGRAVKAPTGKKSKSDRFWPRVPRRPVAAVPRQPSHRT